MPITLGPWEFYLILPQEEGPSKFEVAQSEGTLETVAIVEGHDNAQAIAAVPEMVDALKEGQKKVCLFMCDAHPLRGKPTHSETCQMMLATLAKAEGRES